MSRFLLLFALCLSAPLAAVTLDFDSIVLSPGSTADATAYLDSFGVGFSSVPGATPVIFNATGTAAIAVSSPNVFAVNGPPGQSGNVPLTYELTFATPLLSLSFVRTAVVSGSTTPPWIASVLDEDGNVLDSESEGNLLGPSARLVSLDGPGIRTLRIASNNIVAATFTDPPIDDLTLNVQPIPEPAAVLLLGTGLSVLVAIRARRTP